MAERRAHADLNPYKRDDRSLMAEVVCRRQRARAKAVAASPAPEPPLALDPEEVLGRPGGDRLQWLRSALAQAEARRLDTAPIHRIVSQPRFWRCGEEDARALAVVLSGGLGLFSQEERALLESDAVEITIGDDGDSASEGSGGRSPSCGSRSASRPGDAPSDAARRAPSSSACGARGVEGGARKAAAGAVANALANFSSAAVAARAQADAPPQPAAPLVAEARRPRAERRAASPAILRPLGGSRSASAAPSSSASAQRAKRGSEAREREAKEGRRRRRSASRKRRSSSSSSRQRKKKQKQKQKSRSRSRKRKRSRSRSRSRGRRRSRSPLRPPAPPSVVAALAASRTRWGVEEVQTGAAAAAPRWFNPQSASGAQAMQRAQLQATAPASQALPTGLSAGLDQGALRAAQIAAARRLQVVPVAGASVRPGDWFCPICSAHNYASKFHCFRCIKGTNPLLATSQPQIAAAGAAGGGRAAFGRGSGLGGAAGIGAGVVAGAQGAPPGGGATGGRLL